VMGSRRIREGVESKRRKIRHYKISKFNKREILFRRILILNRRG